MPQSMQRAPCFLSSSCGYGVMTCFQSRRRSVTGRYGCFARLNSLKPVALPMGRFHHCFVFRNTGLPGFADRFQHVLVIRWNDFNEPGMRRLPAVEQLMGDGRVGVAHVTAEYLS